MHPDGKPDARLREADVRQLVDAGLLARRLLRRPEYDAILSFIRGGDPMRLALRMRRAGRSELILTPLHPLLPGGDTLELRIGAKDGVISGQRRSESIAGQAGTRIVDRESLERAVPPEATIAFARALEQVELWSTVDRCLGAPPRD